MSAICGVVDFSGRPVASAGISAMAEAASYRGLNGVRHRNAGSAAFCHLALDATTEASRDRQPLGTPDGAVWLVADVRLDNRGDLLRALEPTGLLPDGRAAGDGEILLAAFLLWGEGCADRLLGDFAFAVWDGRSRQLLCARDPLGVRPLCFSRRGNLFCFATEAQQILHHPAADRSLDERAIADYLAGRPQDPRRSFFRTIHRLPPGHLLIANAAGERQEKFWHPERIQLDDRIGRDAAAERLRETLQQAVSDRLRTPGGAVGLALSGGLDSPAVAVLAQRHLQSSPRPTGQLLTYSFIFDRLTGCDERAYIGPLAAQAGFESAFVHAEDHCLLDDPGLYGTSLESPFEGWLSPHLQGLRLLAGRGARVLLTGQGADDLLQGSPLVLPERLLGGDPRVVQETWRYAATRRRAPWRDLYRLLLRPLLPIGIDASLRRLARNPLPSPVPSWIEPGFASRAGISERLAERRLPVGSGMAHRDVVRHLESPPYEQAVHWLDRIAAPFGIEVRHPFLDRRLAEVVLATPAGQVFELGCNKALLRRAMQGILPDTLRLRLDKTRLGAYVDLSLREKAGGLVDELLATPWIADLGWVEGPALRAAFREYRKGGAQAEKRKIWFAVTLELWLRRHCDILGLGRPERPIETWPAGLAASC
ncbi:MAG TPA: asparagine synthase-related protein [Thermoanaerobaculia bacterium]|nr:asparagine synthase-related protein [Thermoanaerobaculia bacterium]